MSYYNLINVKNRIIVIYLKKKKLILDFIHVSTSVFVIYKSSGPRTIITELVESLNGIITLALVNIVEYKQITWLYGGCGGVAQWLL